tara:strand:- start:2753 stop:5191 length:2439 start_codon:yes stop_codon:yes gene_type:complete
MPKTKNRFTFKIILSYLVLGALAVVVGYFIYSEFKNYLNDSTEKTEEKKFFATGSLINLVYEADSFSRLALLTQKEEDYVKYITLSDSLFEKIENIKSLTNDDYQKKQLDSVRELLTEKKKNIEQLRILKITNSKDSSLDDILNEFKKLDNSMGRLSLETFVNKPEDLTDQERSFWKSYIEFLNESSDIDTTQVQTRIVDSMLAASRYIVAEAKRENSRARRSLQEKENELIRNDLTLSSQLRRIITDFEAENIKLNDLEKANREASVDRTVTILQGAAVVGFIIILLFTYFILTDFFRAERFKKSLEKSKEYAEDLLKSREQLIATVSHDLKTPLNTIVGYTGLMENTPLSEKQNHYVYQITAGSQYVSKLVNDLLDFSKLEAGKLQIESVPFSLENVLQQTVKTYEDMYSEKPVSLVLHIDSVLQNNVYESDPLRIQQILHNLVGNAFKFTEEGSIEVKATQEKANEKQIELRIDVKDTGIGISEEKQQLIFKEFTQAEADTAKKFGGYGLGLAISKKLAKLLDGNLSVKSDLNDGSTFTLQIPLTISTRAVRPAATPVANNLSNLQAVIFDDDPAMRTMLSELFEQMDIKANDFEKFSTFEKLESIDFDFILTDIQMPSISGFEVLNKLKKGEVATYTNQPIIAMTGSREHTRQTYLDKGFAEVLQKPFTKSDLLLVLGKVFPNKFSEPSKKTTGTISEEKSELYDLTLLKSFLETEEALQDVLQVFYKETKKDMAELKAKIDSENIEGVSQTAHKMLTMCRQIDTKKVVPILETLEYISTEEKNDMPSLFEALEKEINNVITDLQKHH